MNNIRTIGHKALAWTQDIGLLIVAVSTIIAVGFEISSMIDAMIVTLADLLLLFIYLEVLAMVAIYLDSGKLPVRMPLYTAIVALARYLILDMKKSGYLENVRCRRRGFAYRYSYPGNSIWSQSISLPRYRWRLTSRSLGRCAALRLAPNISTVRRIYRS